MTLREDIEKYFGTKDLYEVLGVDKKANESQIKKGYRKTSLKCHPDRVEESEKDEATRKFQVLAQVHYVLSDPQRRQLYDEQGIIANSDSLESEANWSDYWRLLFPKISEKDIQDFLDNYIGSEEEEKDLIEIYTRFKGDMDKISQSMIGFEEERCGELLEKLLQEGKIEHFKKFTKETELKKKRRQRRAEKEAKEAEKMMEELRAKMGKSVDSMEDLSSVIKKKSHANFDSMIANLEAKYGGANNGNSKKGVKRKRADR